MLNYRARRLCYHAKRNKDILSERIKRNEELNVASKKMGRSPPGAVDELVQRNDVFILVYLIIKYRKLSLRDT